MKGPQKVRKALILISFLLFPVTIYYFSPVLIIQGAAQGIVVGSALAFAAQFASSLFLGRGFCGWACPGAGLQEALFLARDARARRVRLDWIKWLLWVPWLGAIGYAAWTAGSFGGVEPLYQIEHGVSVAEPHAWVIYFSFVALIACLSLAAGRRAFCHYVCWMAPFMIAGRRLRNSLGWPALRLRAEPERCTRCGACTRACPMSLEVRSMVESGRMENAECILCGSCVDACPAGL